MLRFLQKIWRLFPLSWRRVFWTLIGRRARNFIDLIFVARPQTKRSYNKDLPLVVAGLFRTANGIGEGARGTYEALVKMGLSPIAVDLSEELALVDLETNIPLHPMPDHKQGVLILQLNGPEIVAGLQHLGMKRGRNWYTIGYWAWELTVFPKDWDKAFPFLSEIWAISEFTAKAIRQHSKAPDIHVIGHAVTPPDDIKPDRTKFDLDEQAFVFLTLADSMSSLIRKNPFVVIAAHKQAFGHDPNVQLIVKTRNIMRDPQAYDDLRSAIGDAKNIQILDVSLSEKDRWMLFESVDSIVSLHRSEGFGLTLAEGMALGKPVITTAWSGNMDFTSSDNSYLADYALIPCKDQYNIYKDKTAHWADVNQAEAIRLMKLVYEDDALRQKISQKAKIDISRLASLENLGQTIVERITQLN